MLVRDVVLCLPLILWQCFLYPALFISRYSILWSLHAMDASTISSMGHEDGNEWIIHAWSYSTAPLSFEKAATFQCFRSRGQLCTWIQYQSSLWFWTVEYHATIGEKDPNHWHMSKSGASCRKESTFPDIWHVWITDLRRQFLTYTVNPSESDRLNITITSPREGVLLVKVRYHTISPSESHVCRATSRTDSCSSFVCQWSCL